MTAGGLPACPRARDDLVFRELDDEWVLYDGTGQQIHVLNRTAAIVWLSCTGELTREEIAAELIAAFDGSVDRSRAVADVTAVLTEFQRRELLQ